MSDKLRALQKIANLMLEQQLAALKLANQQRDDTRRKLADLDQPGNWEDGSIQAAARAAMLYQTWVDVRRRDLNLHLARESVAVLKAQDQARLAFGKDMALQRLLQRK